ncbi:MAG: hypothetical protein ABSC23_08590 [Bryobacteraceae bacterium]|jgi:hypothetical protein
MSPRLTRNPPAQDRAGDARLESLRRFFAESGCPALAYAPVFLEAADDYGLDWRLLPGISYIESTGGKAAWRNNFFGWDSGRAKFASPAAGIHAVAYFLSHSGTYRSKDSHQKLRAYNPAPGYAGKVESVMRRIGPPSPSALDATR